MAFSLDFPDDPEFCKLVARRRDVDLTLAALEIARDAYPKLDYAHTLQWIAKRGSELITPAARSESDRHLLRELSRCLAGTHGLHGDRQAFEHPESSYLHRVIETGVGIPISLSLVYLAVADRAGIELSGVAAPMHFLVRYDGVDGVYFLDAFHQGRVLKYDRCIRWLSELSGLEADLIEPRLEPAGCRDIVIRLLNNLKALHIHHEEWESAWNVQRRLTALHPSEYEPRRDLALVALKSTRPHIAADLLHDCLRTAEDKERSLLLNYLHTAELQLAEWN